MDTVISRENPWKLRDFQGPEQTSRSDCDVFCTMRDPVLQGGNGEERMNFLSWVGDGVDIWFSVKKWVSAQSR